MTNGTLVASPQAGIANAIGWELDPHYQERRSHPRLMLTKPVFAIPILPDGSPADAHCADGFSLDVSQGGMRVELGRGDFSASRHMLIGIEADDGVLYYGTVEVRHVERIPQGVRLGLKFVDESRNLLRRENLIPTLDPQSGRFATRLPTEVLNKWFQLGVFRPVIVDRLLVCPRCRSVPTLHRGCHSCGSIHVMSKPLIHHFACAYVGFVGEFEDGGSIVCPKCRTRNLIVGADFEHLNGPFTCFECTWSDNEIDTFGRCTKCASRFPLDQALEEELIGFDVFRLDPLALVAAR